MRPAIQNFWTRPGAPPGNKREEPTTLMRVQIHKTEGAQDADVRPRLEIILESIGEHTVVDSNPDYLIVFGSGVDSKSAGDTLAADVGITGDDAAVWDSSTARIKHSVNVAAPAEPRNIKFTAELSEEQITAIVMPDANFTVSAAPEPLVDDEPKGKKKK